MEIILFEELGGDWQWVTSTELNSPPANAPWSIIIPAFTVNTEIQISVQGKDGSDNQLFWTGAWTRTAKDTNVSGLALNLGNITE